MIITGVLAAVLGLSKSFVSVYWIYITIEFLEGAIADPYSPLYMLSNFIIYLFSFLTSLHVSPTANRLMDNYVFAERRMAL